MTEKERKDYYNRFAHCVFSTLEMEKANLETDLAHMINNPEAIEKLEIINQILRERHE